VVDTNDNGHVIEVRKPGQDSQRMTCESVKQTKEEMIVGRDEFKFRVKLRYGKSKKRSSGVELHGWLEKNERKVDEVLLEDRSKEQARDE